MFSPSLDHPQDALYTVEFVKGKKGGGEGPGACSQEMVISGVTR